jgi:lipopolysaccharide/colanic/teichoic acid biosynthesis glycosyltransferase
MKKNQGLPRSIEIICALTGLIILAPLLLICAVLILLTSRGSVLFRQKRIGYLGKEFTMYKFRTMTVAQSGASVTAATDKRITKIGRFLRKTKIDELPELWNVLRGEMSFVGPRPEVPQFYNPADPLWQEIIRVRPGITDPTTLSFKNEEVLLAKATHVEEFYLKVVQPFKLKGYAEYLHRRSWLTDVSVIFQTIISVIGIHPKHAENKFFNHHITTEFPPT